MRLPGLTSLVLELPWAGGTATSSATQCPAGKDPWWVHPAPQDPPKTPTALEENTASPCASGQELVLACHIREELPLPGMFPTVHSSLLPLPSTFPGLKGRPEVPSQNLQQWGSNPAACLQRLCYIPPGSDFQVLTPSCGGASCWTPLFLWIPSSSGYSVTP